MEIIMQNVPNYEMHAYHDPSFPVIFHIDPDPSYGSSSLPRWHEDIEILCVISGEVGVNVDTTDINARPAETVIINSNCMHTTSWDIETSKYYCLLINKQVCANAGVETVEIGRAHV